MLRLDIKLRISTGLSFILNYTMAMRQSIKNGVMASATCICVRLQNS